MTQTYYRTALNHFDPSGNPVLSVLGMPTPTICEALDELDECKTVTSPGTEAVVIRVDRDGRAWTWRVVARRS